MFLQRPSLPSLILPDGYYAVCKKYTDEKRVEEQPSSHPQAGRDVTSETLQSQLLLQSALQENSRALKSLARSLEAHAHQFESSVAHPSHYVCPEIDYDRFLEGYGPSMIAAPPEFFNSRTAMRVLEDYLCADVLGLKHPMYAPSRSLKKLSDGGAYKESVARTMVKYGLTKHHLLILRDLKKQGSAQPRQDWSDLIKHSISVTDDNDTLNVKTHLFNVLGSFIAGTQGFDVLKSPFFQRK